MRCITRLSAVVAAGASLGALGLTGVSGAGAAGHAPAAHALEVPGAQLWIARYSGTGSGPNDARSVAVNGLGTRVFVTGSSATSGSLDGDRYTGFATIAYNAATGARLWLRRYSGPRRGFDGGSKVVVSPDGTRVYVTGGILDGKATGYDYATIAYNAATGARLWVARYSGPGNGDDGASDLAVSPGGSRVYVTGRSTDKITTADDYATIAYNAATGARLWVRRYHGPGNGWNGASAIAVSGNGKLVYVTGQSMGATSSMDYATIAYRAATGTRLWVRRYNGTGNGYDEAAAVAVSPGGARVYVTGVSPGTSSGWDYATVAYNAKSGASLWVKRHNGPGNGDDEATAVAVSPAGTVFVTGQVSTVSSVSDYCTIAYSPAGAVRWIATYDGPASSDDDANAVAVSPDGSKVYVTGGSDGGRVTVFDYATLAYDAATGARLWVARYNDPGNGDDSAAALAVRAGRVFVTGGSQEDYATIAYKA